MRHMVRQHIQNAACESMYSLRRLSRAVRRATINRRDCSTSTNAYGWNESTNPVPEHADWINQMEVVWPEGDEDRWTSWLDETHQSESRWKADFERNGFVVIRGIANRKELDIYRDMHDKMRNGEIRTPGRHDLGGHKKKKFEDAENVGQIMWPTDLVRRARDGPIHARAYALSTLLLSEGDRSKETDDDISFDFDMLIWKDPRTETETPWHQDEAYWPSGMTDKRALTVWTALDRATIDNGAMWYVSGSHRAKLHPHAPASEGSHVLHTSAFSESTPGAVCIELEAGDAVAWHGRTAHYSRGNITSHTRRTFIVNYRPESMVRWEREHGYDHLRRGMADYATQMEKAGDAVARKGASV